MNANPPIPDYWSPDQALAVYEFLDELCEQVRDRYGEQITERMRREYAEQQARAQLELSFNDEIPF
jgi:predicted secreted protein